jgi:hypothetical protein
MEILSSDRMWWLVFDSNEKHHVYSVLNRIRRHINNPDTTKKELIHWCNYLLIILEWVTGLL